VAPAALKKKANPREAVPACRWRIPKFVNNFRPNIQNPA